MMKGPGDLRSGTIALTERQDLLVAHVSLSPVVLRRNGHGES